MSLSELICQWWGDSENAVFECRNCGLTLHPEDTMCYGCGSIEIARYDIV